MGEVVVNFVDIWEASDAYEYALTNGIQFVCESGKGFNVGNVFSTNNQDGIIRTVPLCGFWMPLVSAYS